jgi:hypothetical protein
MDGSSIGFTTPHTFAGLNGTHTFFVPSSDANDDPFKHWSSGQTSTTVMVSSAGAYMAYYGLSPVHDVAVIDVAPCKAVIGQGYSLNASVTVLDPGDYPETFNVTLYASTIALGNLTFASLPNGTCTFTIFTWNTTDYPYGKYTFSACAWPVSNETDTTDNTFVDGQICVTIPGDLNGDFMVSLADLVILAQAYGSIPGDRNWNPNADIDNSGVAGLTDLAIMAISYGQPYA